MSEHDGKPSPIRVVTDRNGSEFTVEAVLEAALAHAKRAVESLDAAYDMHISEANDALKQADEWRRAVSVIEEQIALRKERTQA